MTPPGCCSYSGCSTDPVHARIVAATLAMEDGPSAYRILADIAKSGMVELARVEHREIVMRRRAELEGRAA